MSLTCTAVVVSCTVPEGCAPNARIRRGRFAFSARGPAGSGGVAPSDPAAYAASVSGRMTAPVAAESGWLSVSGRQISRLKPYSRRSLSSAGAPSSAACAPGLHVGADETGQPRGRRRRDDHLCRIAPPYPQNVRSPPRPPPAATAAARQERRHGVGRDDRPQADPWRTRGQRTAQQRNDRRDRQHRGGLAPPKGAIGPAPPAIHRRMGTGRQYVTVRQTHSNGP
jgi:hypothetical protein